MPRYFFDTHDGDTFLPDDEGQEFDGIEAVRLQAQGGLADLARDVVPGEALREPWSSLFGTKRARSSCAPPSSS
jgi:hypothetical protein